MDQIVTYILFAHVMALFICSILQLTVKNRLLINGLMALLYFLVGYLFLYFWLYRTEIIFEFPLLLHSDLAATFVIGPIAYAYIRIMTGEEVGFSFKNAYRYLPALLVFCFFILYHAAGIAPAGNGRSQYPDYHSDPLVYIVSIMADMFLFFYIFLVAKKIYMLMLTDQFRVVKEIRIIFYILICLIISTFLLFPAHYLKSDVLIGLVSISSGSLSVIYFLFSYRHPEFTQMVIKKPGAGKKPGIFPVNIDVPRVMEKLTDLMETEYIYRNSAITLQSLSNSLEINSNRLSQVLNEKLGVNFRSYLNRYRIEEAKELLTENHEMTVLEIAFAVGFNSKSTFNTTFTSVTGVTPTGYRKNSI